MKRLGKKGISTVYGSILLVTLVIIVNTTLITALYGYGNSIQSVIELEEERLEEGIVLRKLITYNVSEVEYIQAILANNTGSITSRIKAIYIDNEFLCDPSNTTLNPNDTYINAKESMWILLPTGVPYEPTSKIGIATERGIKSFEYEYVLKYGLIQPVKPPKYYFGPLELDFEEFYYARCESNGTYDPSTLEPAWKIEVATGDIIWNITVRNIDDRNITINQFSCLTLWPNDKPSNRRAWYIEPLQEPYTQFIAVNETVNVIYIWKTPKMKQMDPQSIYTTICRNKVFLTFFGIFHEHDGSIKPYGQTIPFEAVHCVKSTGTIKISAWPTTIHTDSSMYSTITVQILNRWGETVPNANVTFSTDLGTLSSMWTLSNANGNATVLLHPGSTPGMANITAIWGGLSNTVAVNINASPVAVVSSNATDVATGEVVSFNASNSYDPDGGIVSYLWDFGDDSNATGVTATHSYSEDGLYTVVLTVTDDDDGTGTDQIMIKVDSGG